jgi:hypothetical protein
MQFMEASKKAGLFRKDYAAMVVIAPESEEHFLAELSQAGGALIDWKRDRGASAKEVRFTVVCKEDLNGTVKERMRSAFESTPVLVDLVSGVAVSVDVLNKGQTPADSFTL